MTVLQEVKAKMTELLRTRAEALEAIQEKQADAEARKADAVKAMRAATEDLNAEAYEAAKIARDKAIITIEMCRGRYGQIQRQELISEAESDAVIDSLLSYEDAVTKDFKSAIEKPLRIIFDLRNTYLDEIKDTEATLATWQRDVHANYNTRGATTYTDPETGERTTRSKTPIEVHKIPYAGCNEAAILGTLQQKLPASLFRE